MKFDPRRLIFISLFVFCFVLYIYTLSPGWGPINIFNTWDGLEYVLCSSLLGIDHPPGHPLYLLLAKLFSSIFIIGSVAYRMNLFSAFFGALTSAMVYLVAELSLRLSIKIKDPTQTHIAAFAAAGVFAVSKVFWLHSLITEVHTLYLFLISVAFYFSLRLLESEDKKWLSFIALLFGLLISTSIFNAVTAIFPLFVFLTFIILTSTKIKLSFKDCFFFLGYIILGASFYLYYPIISKIGPGFVHPMNLMTMHDLGSSSWFFWFISGKAWTGGGMFSLGRVFLNFPNFLRHIIENFTILSLGLFISVIIFGFNGIYNDISKEIKYGLTGAIRKISTSSKVFILLIFSFIFIAIPQLSITDVSNPGSTTYIYLANFFLPSFLIFSFFIGIGIGILLQFIQNKDIMRKLIDFFSQSKQISEQTKKSALLLTVYCLLIFPMYLLAVNYMICDLRGNNTGYEFARGIFKSFPDSSVLYSKLVYQLAGTYFSEIDPIIKNKGITYKNPDVMGKNILFKASSNPILDKTNFLKNQIKNDINNSKPVFIGGDCVDQDKAPEVLLISDLELMPMLPQELVYMVKGPYPTELLPYEVISFKKADKVFGALDIQDQGMANNGTFSSYLRLLGFSGAEESGPLPGRNRISLDFYWEVLSDIRDDYVGIISIFDERLGRIDPERTVGFFTLGGEYKSSEWKKGSKIKQKVDYYLPNLIPGKYYMALGLIDSKNLTVPYLPADYDKNKQIFDFVLLMPFGIGNPEAFPQGMPR